jgi:hypothetical protein
VENERERSVVENERGVINSKRNRDVGTKNANLKLSRGRDVEMKRGKRGGGEQLLGADAQRNWVLTESVCHPQPLMLRLKIFSSVFKLATLQHFLFNFLASSMLLSRVFSCISNIINATRTVKDHSNCRIFRHHDVTLLRALLLCSKTFPATFKHSTTIEDFLINFPTSAMLRSKIIVA